MKESHATCPRGSNYPKTHKSLWVPKAIPRMAFETFYIPRYLGTWTLRVQRTCRGSRWRAHRGPPNARKPAPGLLRGSTWTSQSAQNDGLTSPNMMVLGSKFYTYNGLWCLVPSYLGTRTSKGAKNNNCPISPNTECRQYGVHLFVFASAKDTKTSKSAHNMEPLLPILSTHCLSDIGPLFWAVCEIQVVADGMCTNGLWSPPLRGGFSQRVQIPDA